MITISAFKDVPPFAQGLVRDLRLRWALEEAGLRYEERLLDQGDQQTDQYRKLQPFGQVPSYEEGGLILFESGAIVLHIAERSETLAPRDPAGKARMTCWLLGALNSVEPAIANLAEVDLFYPDEDWAKARRPLVVQEVKDRLARVADALQDDEYLDGGQFTAADLMMTTVLRILRHTDLLAQYPALNAYKQRCEARPAFQRAPKAQMAVFEKYAA